MKYSIISLMFAVGVMIASTGCAKIVKTGSEAELTGEVSFAETLDVSSFWDSQAVPEVEETAVELKQLLVESAGDIDSRADEYGRKTDGAVSSTNFAVHGTGIVKEINTEKKAGFIVIELDDYDGDEEIRLQIGSVIKKTSIRDYLSFINVNNYSDQIQYAELSKAINTYVCENVIAPVDIASSEGKGIEFYGCFTADNDHELLITPVVIELK